MSKAKFADVYKKYMPLYKDSLMTPPVAQELQGALPYNPIDAAKRSAYASADLAAQRQNALAEQQRQVSVIDAQRAYERSLPTYGSAAERYLSAGLSGSGFTDYAAANAYATMRGEVSAARAAENAAKQDVMYQRMAAYQSADQAAMQAQNEVYSQLLQAVYGGGLSADDVKRVAGHYGLSDASMVGALQDAAKFYAEMEQAAYKQAQQDLQDRITAAQDMSAEDAEAYAAQFYDVGSAGYETIVDAARQAAEQREAVMNEAAYSWSISGYNPNRKQDGFNLTIGGETQRVKVGKDFVTDSRVRQLNELATGDENTPPTVREITKKTTGSAENPAMLQVLKNKNREAELYMYVSDKSGSGWKKVEGAKKWAFAPQTNTSKIAADLADEKIESLVANADRLPAQDREELEQYIGAEAANVKTEIDNGTIFKDLSIEDKVNKLLKNISPSYISAVLDDKTKKSVAEAFSNSAGRDGIKTLLKTHGDYPSATKAQRRRITKLPAGDAIVDAIYNETRKQIANILKLSVESEVMNALDGAIRDFAEYERTPH